MQLNFGGGAPMVSNFEKDTRPITQRNKSFVELGDKNARTGYDDYRKQ